MLVANTALVTLVRLSFYHVPVLVHWEMQVAISYLVLFTSAFVAVHQWMYWSRPTKRLAGLLPLVRRGHEPIEELSKIGGGLKEAVSEMQTLLRELRRQHADLNQLEMELSQRVAHRTDALERSLGAMRQQASRDALTGLLNRRVLDETLPAMMAKCRGDRRHLSVMMIDVDNFKPLNDTLGHGAGDELLRSIGQIFRSNLVEGQAAFRYGGDEFVLVLPDVNLDEAKLRAHQLAKLVEALTKHLSVARPPQLSIGVLSLAEAPTADANQFLREADRLLYRIKAARRRRRTSDIPAMAGH